MNTTFSRVRLPHIDLNSDLIPIEIPRSQKNLEMSWAKKSGVNAQHLGRNHAWQESNALSFFFWAPELRASFTTIEIIKLVPSGQGCNLPDDTDFPFFCLHSKTKIVTHICNPTGETETSQKVKVNLSYTSGLRLAWNTGDPGEWGNVRV